MAACAVLILTTACTTNWTRRSYMRELRPLLSTPQRPVIIITGFGLTRLYDPETRQFVWGTFRNTVDVNYHDDFDLPIDPVTAEILHDRLVPRGFAGSRAFINTARRLSEGLGEFGGYALQRSGEGPIDRASVFVLEYDWRMSATDSTRHLDRLIDEIRTRVGDPHLKVDLVGHSAGGLVALTYLRIGTARLEEPGQWNEGSRRAGEKVENLITLAAPIEGTIEVFRVLTRDERIGRRSLSAEAAVTFPTLTELLPKDGRFLVDEQGMPRELDVWHIDTWRKLGLSIFAPEQRRKIIISKSVSHFALLERAFERSLRQAKELQRVQTRPLPPGVRVLAIGSDCYPTARQVVVRADGSVAFYRNELQGAEKERFREMFVPGDGSISAQSATSGLPAQFVCNGHFGIASDPQVHRAILRELLDK